MTHIIAGYPSLNTSEQLAMTMTKNGADILEIQIPFSDPIADGPIIAQANDEALKHGVSVVDCLEMIGRLVKKTNIPIVIMTYFNIVFHFGADRFCKLASEKGVQGLIIPDYPFDEELDNNLIANCKKYNLNFIPVVAPTTRQERLKQVIKKGSGFIYCVARAGTTGQKTEIHSDILQYLNNVRKITDLPIAVGFGLSEKAQIKALEPYADITVIGSALIKQYQNKPLNKGKQAVEKFLGQLII